jgi:hypothetical protein
MICGAGGKPFLQGCCHIRFSFCLPVADRRRQVSLCLRESFFKTNSKIALTENTEAQRKI